MQLKLKTHSCDKLDNKITVALPSSIRMQVIFEAANKKQNSIDVIVRASGNRRKQGSR